MSSDPQSKPLSPLIDAQALAELQDLAGDEYVSLYEEFLAGLPERSQQIAAVGNQPESLQRPVHSLRGAAISLGLQRLADQAARVEEACESGSVPPDALQALNRALQDTQDLLKAGI